MSKTDLLPDSVFKAYDIRGIVPRQLDPPFARRLGLALARRAHEQEVSTLVVGYDGRLSSPALAEALHQGLLEGGIHTLDLGTVPTPLVYFAAHTSDTGSGVAITGSHNPPDYNGFKIMMAGATLHGADIQAIKRAMTRFPNPPRNMARGRRTRLDVVPSYVRRITGDVRLARPLKIAVDCGNGVGGAVAPMLFEALGCEVIPLYCEVDGTFPNHHPDPAEPANLSALIAQVRNEECDLGLAFDGDADRLGVVTRSGQIIWADRQLILHARDILSRLPGATIILDVKCSRHAEMAIRAAGGVPLMWKTGHSPIKAKMAETGSPLAAEMSGHVFFKERWFGFDDALYAGARLLELLSHEADPSAVLEALPQALSTPELKLSMPEGLQHVLIKRLQEAQVFADAVRVLTLDGVRAEFDDGFGLARASNTTPTIILRFEGETQEALERIQNDFRTALLALQPDLSLPF